MGINNITTSIKNEFICDKCCRHYLLELISDESKALLRGYCFCGESTIQIENPKEILFLNEFQFYENYKCKCVTNIYENKKKVWKYCDKCNEFLCKECSNSHEHNNSIFEPDILTNKCKYHSNEELIGFCKHCKKPICQECINYFHKKHEIKLTKDLIKTDEYVENYEKNLEKAISDFNKFMKMKYGEIEITIPNLDNKENINIIYGRDRQTVTTLQILKTILDLYNYHKDNGTLNYQIISNMLNNLNFEIVRLPDKINNRFKSFSGSSLDDENNKINKNINVCLEINLKSKMNERKIINKINIENYKLYGSYKEGENIKKLKNGNLILYGKSFTGFRIIEDLKENKYYEIRDRVIDFMQLKNEKFVFLTKKHDNSEICRLLIIIKEGNEFKIEKRIDLNKKRNYCKLIPIDSFKILLFSYSNKKQKTYIELIILQNLKSEKTAIMKLLSISWIDKLDLILKTKISEWKFIKNGNLIMIAFNVKELCIIYFYDLKDNKLESISINLNLNNNLQTPNNDNYNEILNIMNIDNERILLSSNMHGIILNIKTKQIESKIKDWNNLYCICKVNKCILAGFYGGRISQINIYTKEIYNNFILKRNEGIDSIVDIGNHTFCVVSKYNNIYIFEYK